MIAWLWRRWPLWLVALACGVFVAQSDAGTGTKVAVVVIAGVALLIWNFAHNLRVHTTINRHVALGQHQAILSLVEPELAGQTADSARVPFLIYKATALMFQGHFEDARAVLNSVQPKRLRDKNGRIWRFLHASQRVHCLCFLGDLEAAETALTDEVEQFAIIVRSPATAVIVDEARAKLAFFQGRDDDSRERLQKLLEDGRITPASQALYHHLLAQLDLRAGADQDAETHFARARELAPDTFYGTRPAAVEQDG